MNMERKGLATAFCLSFHAAYRCGRSGACCTAGWDILAEPPVVAALTRRFGASAHGQALTLASQPDGSAILARTAGGACVFFDASSGRLCAVHRELGEPLLPSACRQFPRVTLADPRGRWITLSHFCPTAAALLFTSDPVTIVPAPDAISLGGAAEGLDATAALPPLLRPGMLMDLDGYAAWERGALQVLATHGASARHAMSALGRIAGVVQRWSPGGEPLHDCVTRAFLENAGLESPADATSDAGGYALVLSSVPEGLAVPLSAPPHSDDPTVEIVCDEYDAVVRRYLAAKLFGCWWPYFGLDLAGVVAAVRLHASVLRARLGARLAQGDRDRTALLEAIRETDLLMVHLADGGAVAKRIGRVRLKNCSGS